MTPGEAIHPPCGGKAGKEHAVVQGVLRGHGLVAQVQTDPVQLLFQDGELRLQLPGSLAVRYGSCQPGYVTIDLVALGKDDSKLAGKCLPTFSGRYALGSSLPQLLLERLDSLLVLASSASVQEGTAGARTPTKD